jgi:hypothetical protein
LRLDVDATREVIDFFDHEIAFGDRFALGLSRIGRDADGRSVRTVGAAKSVHHEHIG